MLPIFIVVHEVTSITRTAGEIRVQVATVDDYYAVGEWEEPSDAKTEMLRSGGNGPTRVTETPEEIDLLIAQAIEIAGSLWTRLTDARRGVT